LYSAVEEIVASFYTRTASPSSFFYFPTASSREALKGMSMQPDLSRALQFLPIILCVSIMLSSLDALAKSSTPTGKDYMEACKAWAKYSDVPEGKLLPEPEILVDLQQLEKGVKAAGVFEIYVACVPGKKRDLVVRKQNPSWHLEWNNPIVDFADPQYIAWSTPGVTRRYAASSVPERRSVSNGFLFEAVIAPNLYFPQLIHKGEGGTFVGSLLFTFQARLRMLNDTSSPVIPPSFMPKLSLQSLFFLPSFRSSAGSADGFFEYRLVWGAQLTLGHHSNGQEGCFGGNETGIDGANCQATDSLPSFPPNEINGSYSTNYLRATLMFRNIFGLDYAGDLSASWFATAAYERHLQSGPGGISPRQARYTGWNHVLLTGGIEYPVRMFGVPSGRFSLEGSADFSPDADIAYAAGLINFRAMLKYRPANRGFGIFVGSHFGRDNYNILFSQGVTRLLIGLSYDSELYRGIEGI
jgi:hypothetical protein